MGETLRSLYASGKLRRPKLSVETRQRIGRKVSAAHKGKVLRKTPLADWEKRQTSLRAIARRGPGNPKERLWKLRSPKNRTFIFKNLQHFVRTRPELFDSDDVIWRGKACFATKGLQMLSPRKKHPVGSWKGWTWYSHFEQLKNNGKDLLDRYVENESTI